VAALASDAEVDAFASEMKDRFGGLPQEVSNLLQVMRIKALCRRLLITRIREAKGDVRVSFAEGTPVQPAHILAAGRARKGRIRFLQDGFEVLQAGGKGEETQTAVLDVLREIGGMAPLQTAQA